LPAASSHNDANGFNVSIDNGIAVVVVIFGPIVAVVVIRRRVRVDVGKELRRSGQNFPEIGKKSGIVFFKAEIIQFTSVYTLLSGLQLE
jgi:hypothetical protein